MVRRRLMATKVQAKKRKTGSEVPESRLIISMFMRVNMPVRVLMRMRPIFLMGVLVSMGMFVHVFVLAGFSLVCMLVFRQRFFFCFWMLVLLMGMVFMHGFHFDFVSF
jgi:hypothetical protein